MIIWEHLYELVGYGESISEVLNARGKEGWEPWCMTKLDLGTVGSTTRSIYFKRPKEA